MRLFTMTCVRQPTGKGTKDSDFSFVITATGKRKNTGRKTHSTLKLFFFINYKIFKFIV